MQVSLENIGSLGRKLTVQVPHDEIDSKVNTRIQDLGRQVRLKGFRPGKIPYKVLEQRFGKQVRQEVVGEVIQQSFQQAIVQEKLRPASQPEIAAEPPQPNEDLEFTASFDVLPELEALNVDGLKVEKPVAEVSKEDVEGMIDTLREQRRSWDDSDEAAAEDDLVIFQFHVDLDDGRFPSEGEERAGAIVGRGAFEPKVEKKLIGAKVGDEVSATTTFGDSFREPALAGKKGKLTLQVEKIQTSSLPEVNEEFAASFGVEGGNLDVFRDDVRRNMERELKTALSSRLRNVVLDALIKAHPDLEVPGSMIEQEVSALQQQALEQARRMGAEDAETPAAELFADQAERRVRAALLVSEVARHGQIQVDGGRVRDAVNEIAATYEDPQAIINLYYSDERLMGNVQNVVLEEQAVEWVLERAEVSEVASSFSEIMTPRQGA